MFKVLLTDYYAYCKKNKLDVSEIVMLIIYTASLIGVLVGVYFQKQWITVITIGVCAGDIIILLVKMNNNMPNPEEKFKRKREEIDYLIGLLKRENVRMYDIDSINWLINQAVNYSKQGTESVWGQKFKDYFNTLIYPILCFLCGVIIKNTIDQKQIVLCIMTVGELICLFLCYRAIYPEIKRHLNTYKIFSLEMKDDLEIIRNEFGKNHRKE